MKKGFWCAAALLCSSLTAPSFADPAPSKQSAPQLCVAAGEVLEIEVHFRAVYQNVVELRVGDRVLRRFDNKFAGGTDADQGAGAWSIPAFDAPTCIAVTSYHRSGGREVWKANRHLQRRDGIGFEDAADNDFNDAEILFRVQAPLS